MTKYTSIKVPKLLAEKIRKVADERGYRSITEFILDASRRRIEGLEWSHYPMRVKWLDVCNIIGCGAFAIECKRRHIKKEHCLTYWLPLCKKHLLELEK